MPQVLILAALSLALGYATQASVPHSVANAFKAILSVTIELENYSFEKADLYEEYLKDHPNPEDCEFYFCGPPLMLKAVQKMCDDFGVPEENVRFDDFG